MDAFAIVKQLDVLEDLRPGLVSRLIAAVMNDLIFERTEETFRYCVVVAVALAAHAAHHPILFKQRQIAGTGIQNPLVAMVNETRWGRRCSTAIIKASLTSSWLGRSFMDQPTT